MQPQKRHHRRARHGLLGKKKPLSGRRSPVEQDWSPLGERQRVPCWRGRIYYTPAAYDPPMARGRLPSPFVQRFVIRVLSESKKGRKRGRRPIGVRSPFEGDHSTEGNQRSRQEAIPRQLVPSCLPKPAPFSAPVPFCALCASCGQPHIRYSTGISHKKHKRHIEKHTPDRLIFLCL